MSVRTRVSHGLPTVNGLEQPCLVEIYGPNLGRTVVLDGPLTTFGRAAECDVAFDLDNVSRRHCTIHARERGHCVGDDGSTNGTFVNDEEVDGERVLRAGDLLRLGSVVYKFLTADQSGGVEAQYHETIYRLTITDGLTQLYNKRYLLEFLEREMARAARHRRPLSVLLLDVDRFKNIFVLQRCPGGCGARIYYRLEACPHCLTPLRLRRDKDAGAEAFHDEPCAAKLVRTERG